MAEDATMTAADQDRLTEALSTIAEVVLGRQVDALARKLEQALDEQREVVEELDQRTTRVLAELRQQIQDGQERTERDAETARQALRQDFDLLSRGLTEVQLGLQQQQETTERVSGLLNNVASVFTGLGASNAPWQAPDIPEVTVAGADGQPLEGGVDLDGTVEDIFTD